jgi:hypothetical protein
MRIQHSLKGLHNTLNSTVAGRMRSTGVDVLYTQAGKQMHKRTLKLLPIVTRNISRHKVTTNPRMIERFGYCSSRFVVNDCKLCCFAEIIYHNHNVRFDWHVWNRQPAMHTHHRGREGPTQVNVNVLKRTMHCWLLQRRHGQLAPLAVVTTTNKRCHIRLHPTPMEKLPHVQARLLHPACPNVIIIIMLPNQAIASTPSAPRPSGAEGRVSTAPLCLQLLRTSQACTRYSAILLEITRHLPLLPQISSDTKRPTCTQPEGKSPNETHPDAKHTQPANQTASGAAAGQPHASADT